METQEEILIKELKVKVNKTFFEHSVIYIRDELFRNMPSKYDFYIQYNFVEEKKTFVKKHSASKQNSETEYKLQCGKDFAVSVAARTFMASKAAWYLSDDYNLDIGERLIFELRKKDDRYYLVAKGVYNLPDFARISIADDVYSAKMLRKIASTFIPRYSGAKVPKKDKKDSVLWNNPTDWIKFEENSDDFLQSLKVYNAVYMWVGHDSNHIGKKYVYIGIVGDDNNISNSVGQRMQQHIRDKGIVIDYFRYSELVNHGNSDKVEVLKTVEMQCINIVSGLIQGMHEPVIHGKIKMAVINDKQFDILMLNKSVRFQQGYGSGDLKTIS